MLIARFALEAAELSPMFLMPDGSGRPALHRFGLAVGPAVAGVCPAHRPRYMLFGAAADEAVRLEASSQPGRVHVSEAFARALRPQDFSPGGPFAPHPSLSPSASATDLPALSPVRTSTSAAGRPPEVGRGLVDSVLWGVRALLRDGSPRAPAAGPARSGVLEPSRLSRLGRSSDATLQSTMEHLTPAPASSLHGMDIGGSVREGHVFTAEELRLRPALSPRHASSSLVEPGGVAAAALLHSSLPMRGGSLRNHKPGAAEKEAASFGGAAGAADLGRRSGTPRSGALGAGTGIAARRDSGSFHGGAAPHHSRRPSAAGAGAGSSRRGLEVRRASAAAASEEVRGGAPFFALPWRWRPHKATRV